MHSLFTRRRKDLEWVITSYLLDDVLLNFHAMMSSKIGQNLHEIYNERYIFKLSIA